MADHVVDGCQCEGKLCSQCKTIQCVGLFGRDKRLKSGLKSYCKICNRKQCKSWHQSHAAHDQSYRDNNRELIRERGRTHYRNNREKYRAYRHSHVDEIRERRKSWAQRNAPKMRESRSAWKQRNAEYVKEYAKASNPYRRAKYQENPTPAIEQSRAYKLAHPENYREYARKNPDIIRAKTANRRARRKQALGRYTAQEWQTLKSQYAYTCLRCGKKEPEIKLTPDHIVPLARNGPNTIENIQPLCFSCNSWKRTKTIDYRRPSDAIQPE